MAFAGDWSLLPTKLTPWLRDVIQSMGHSQMTPVQSATIPLFMKHKDVVVEAVTGSGKTLAFVIPVLEKLIRRERKHRHNQLGALIISPTRELATQIHSIFSQFLNSQPTDHDHDPLPPPLLLISSDNSSPAKDVQRFLETSADIAIGTPGRVEEFLLGKGRDSVNVKDLEVLVLDEADRLLDLGFQAALTRIITHLPKQRRTGLFSATMTDADALSELVRVGLRNPARVVVKVQSKKLKGTIEERRIPANLENYYISCRTSEKLVQLTRIVKHEMRTHGSSQFIVYFSTCAAVDYFYRILPLFLSSSTTVHSLHGNLQPSARTRTLAAFASAVSTPISPNILLATDVAARGLDLPHVDVVIQFDPPTDTKAFSHRCGRTARAGRSGRAWVLLCGRETEYIDLLQVRKIPIIEKPAFVSDDGATRMDVDASEESPEDPAVDAYLTKAREFVLKDRARNDLAMKAFVSFTRAYSKHEASYVFRLKDLDLVGLGKAYGLLRLPRMPELKDLPPAALATWTDATVDWNTYAYADASQETKRLSALEEEKTKKSKEDIAKKVKERAKRKEKAAPWSQKVERQDERAKRKEKRVAKAKWLRTKEEAKAGDKRGRGGEGEDEGMEKTVDGDDFGDDWDDLAREERMAKKVKKGEVSQRAFDAEFGDL